MRRFVAWFVLMACWLFVATNGCSSGNPPNGGSAEVATGDVDVALVHNGVAIDSASYVVTGPLAFSRSGTIDVRHSATISTTIGGLPAGAGYTITITAGSDAGVACAGSATFSITAHAVATVVVAIQCREPPRTGSAQVRGEINVCPVVDGLSTDLAEVNVGSKIALSGDAHDSDMGPQALGYQWTATSGTLRNANAKSAELTCTAAGPSVVTLTISDGNCTDTLSATVTCSRAPVLEVQATVETDPVPHAGDAADDPVVWVNPVDPALSTIIGTDKTAAGGLGVYDLSGHQIQFVSAGELNNVDLRTGFPLGGASVALVTAGNRTNNSIAIYKIDPATRQLVDVAARTITTLTTYGSCMYHSAVTGKFYYFVDSKAGEIEQWELFDNGSGLVDATKVRNLPKLGTQPEACVTDDELGLFYIGEEDVGIWKFGAEPGGADAGPLATGMLVDGTGAGGHLVADVEGLAIARTGAGTGFLVAANQGDSTYAVYTREGANSFVKMFRVASGSSCIDEVTGSDGIEVVTASLGPAFPFGAFVTQDDANGPSGNQNFKLVPWQDIMNGPTGGIGSPNACVPDAAAPDAGPVSSEDAASVSDGGSSNDGAAAGFSAEFCAAFCGKCASCWNPSAGFSEGDCLYQLVKPNFSLDDCLAGCAIGRTPGFPPANLPAGWEALACLEFDNSI